MNNVIKFFKAAESGIKDVEFLKYLFPILAILGPAVFLYYGYKGIFLKSTINLYKPRGISSVDAVNSIGSINGVWAIIFGSFYIVIGLFLLLFLGGLSYYIWF